MSRLILERLHAAHAFKPKPPDPELARAHVEVSDVGIPHPIDDGVISAMAGPAGGVTGLIGPPGSGKSSLLAAAARARRRSRPYADPAAAESPGRASRGASHR